jgi:hypothetical protein
VPNDEMKMTVVWGITSYIHGDVLTIRVLFLIICLAHVWHMGYTFGHNCLKRGIGFCLRKIMLL